MRCCLVLLIVCACKFSFAQDDLKHISLNKKEKDQDSRYYSIGLNPFSLAESQMSMGPCAGYRFSQRLELWAEAGYIFHNSYMRSEWSDMRGLRFILQPRYYFKRSYTTFITTEFRWKYFSFNNRLDFINPSIMDTLRNYPFREEQVLMGGALVLGKKYTLSRRNNLFMEVTIGIGGKQRYIKRNVPDGYLFDSENYSDVVLGPTYESDRVGNVYFPLGFRLIKKL